MVTGLAHPEDLAAWQRWQDRQHPLRSVKARLRPPGPATGVLTAGGPAPTVLVAIDSTSPSNLAALLAPVAHLDPARVVVLSPGDVRSLLPDGRWTTRDWSTGEPLPEVGAVLSAGHYLALGAASYELARGRDVPFVVPQHGALTPMAPPLPRGAVLCAWSEEDAGFWRSGRTEITSHVVGSELLWQAGRAGHAAGFDPTAAPTYLGQLHGAELPRRDLAAAARDFCRTTGATYRPHPSERDRASRRIHASVGARGDPRRPVRHPAGSGDHPGRRRVLHRRARGGRARYPRLGRLPPPAGLAGRLLGALPDGTVGRTAHAGAHAVRVVAGRCRRRPDRRAVVTDSRILCLVPARGGSKGIPRKNLREVAGKPLIVWTLEQALATPGLDVVVSTDDPEIAEVARAAGAEVPFLRPAELATDTTATEPVVLHAVDAMTALGRAPDAVLLLQATSPVRLPGTLERARAEFADTGVDSMVGVVPHPPFLWRLGADGAPPRAEYDVDHRLRRQDMTATDLRYRETGSLYLTRTEVYREHGNRLGGRIGLFVMDELEGIDVDTELDLALAERKLAELAGA